MFLVYRYDPNIEFNYQIELYMMKSIIAFIIITTVLLLIIMLIKPNENTENFSNNGLSISDKEFSKLNYVFSDHNIDNQICGKERQYNL